ncbi:MAG: CPBP family intramembrane metalloprotease [Chloroflexi bacterium]|nr:CPBP family intramembrane metalloprotease [Chloroflexota bacterium]
MITKVASVNSSVRLGWIGIIGMALIYALLYALNLNVPLASSPIFHYNNYVTRIWSWSEFALTGAALVVLFTQRRVSIRVIVLGFVLAWLSGASIYLRNGGMIDAVQEGLVVFLTFWAGTVLFERTQGQVIAAFQNTPMSVIRSLMFGIVVAIPFAAINNLFFYMNSGTVIFKDGWRAALLALSPGISEEIIFRYFVIALCAWFLQSDSKQRLGLWTAIFLSVVPHSLNHLPDLFLTNPAMAVFMLAATCLLFGLPMAILQVKRNLETAIAFHWFIDFARFLFGY